MSNILVTQNDELYFKDAVDLVRLIRTKAISCKELMQVFLDRRKAINPSINAIINPVPEDVALIMAEKADHQISKNNPVGPLHGLPIATKEMLPVKGQISAYCWAAGVRQPELKRLNLHQPQAEDSLLAARMRRAGLLFTGQTNMPEFAFGSHTKNELYGVTRNPYDLSKTVGGSSGGAGAALATGMLPLADGSDLGGSLRNPAAFCNVVGFRPSIGRVPNLNKGWAARMGTEGPMGRTVRDVALLLSVQAGHHPGDPLSIREDPLQFAQSLEANLTGKRIGWTTDFEFLPVENPIRNTFEKALAFFEVIGMQVSPTYPKLMAHHPTKGEMDAQSVFETLRVVNLANTVLPLKKAIGEEGLRRFTSPIVQYQMIDAFQQVNAEMIYQANDNRHRIYRLFLDFFENHDFLVCPTTQVTPFDVETDYVRQINGRSMNNYLEWMSICCILSLTGLPVISVPCGFCSYGLPVGLQIVGKPHKDLEVLQVAHAFQKALPTR